MVIDVRYNCDDVSREHAVCAALTLGLLMTSCAMWVDNHRDSDGWEYCYVDVSTVSTVVWNQVLLSVVACVLGASIAPCAKECLNQECWDARTFRQLCWCCVALFVLGCLAGGGGGGFSLAATGYIVAGVAVACRSPRLFRKCIEDNSHSEWALCAAIGCFVVAIPLHVRWAVEEANRHCPADIDTEQHCADGDGECSNGVAGLVVVALILLVIVGLVLKIKDTQTKEEVVEEVVPTPPVAPRPAVAPHPAVAPRPKHANDQWVFDMEGASSTTSIANPFMRTLADVRLDKYICADQQVRSHEIPNLRHYISGEA